MTNRQRAGVGVGLGLLGLVVSVHALAAQGRAGGASPNAWARRTARGDVEAWFVKDLYARLLRYDYAARQLAAADAGRPPSPEEFLIVHVRNMRTRQTGGEIADPTGAASPGGTIRLTRQTQCHREDPCLVSYRVEWSTPNDPPELATGMALPAGPVVTVTTYDVVVTLGGETRAYTAEVRYHAGDGGARMPEVVDPVLPGLQQLVDDRAPLAMPQWDRYVKTRRYAAVVNRLKGLARAGKSVVPGRSPIGFLPGDDVTAQDEQLVMMTSGVPCQESCAGQPNGTPCSDEGDPSCSVDRCQGGACTHEVVPPIGACPGVLGWDTSGLTPGTLAALTCLENLVVGAGGRVTRYESAYRPQSYQDHLYSIHVAYEKLVLANWSEFECADTRLTADAEKTIHRLGSEVAQTSYHTDGTAFDVHVQIPQGYDLSGEAQRQCHLVRDYPSEQWHWHYVGG